MKKLFISILVIFSVPVMGQKFVDIIKFHPLDVYYNSSIIEWEHREKNNAIVVAVGIPMKSGAKGNWFNTPTQLLSYSFQVGYHKYINENWYLGANLVSKTYDFNNIQFIGSTKGYIYTTSINFVTGYQIFVWKHLAIDAFTGIGIGRCNGRTNSYSENTDSMVEYISTLAQKLPKRANVNITQNVNTVYSNAQGFAIYQPLIGISIGYKF